MGSMFIILFLDLWPRTIEMPVFGTSKYSLNNLATSWFALPSFGADLTQSKNT